jgi:hypothetical protein
MIQTSQEANIKTETPHHPNSNEQLSLISTRVVLTVLRSLRVYSLTILYP